MPTAEFPALERDGYAGKKLGRFEVMAKLGVGGMSEVFLAWQKAVGGFQRPVVLKRILEAVKRNEEFLRMFVKEAKITSALNHSGIAHLYELVHDEGELFMVMEFVAGATLVEVARACHQTQEPIPIGFTTSVVRDTALALHYAHTFADAAGRLRPVIHRDVAEKNIMVGLDGMVKLLDFGIARQTDQPHLTQVGTVKGTAGYMSPEQVRGEKLDGRTDVFSLGVVLHECLTGQRLFRRNSLSEEVQALLEAPIAPPSGKNRDISAELDAVTMKALARDRTQRYATAKEMADALERASADELWSQQTRAEFIQRHFEVRQNDIVALLGDPSSTDLGDLLPETAQRRERVTRDEFRTVQQRSPSSSLEEERTVEVRTLTGRTPEPRASGSKDARAMTVDGPPPRSRRMPMPSSAYDDEPQTVLGLPGDPPLKGGLTSPPALKGSHRRTEPALDMATQDGRPPLDTVMPATDTAAAISDDGSEGTVIDNDDAQARVTDESNSPSVVPQTASPARRRLRNLAAQKQALLMWIAIGSGLVLGVVLAAFLIFG